MDLRSLLNRANKPSGLVISNEILLKATAILDTEAEERAVRATKGLLEMFESQLEQNVSALRRVRAEEKAQAKRVNTLDRALRYFASSGNPLPVYDALGARSSARHFCDQVKITVPEKDDPAWQVPVDFVVDTTES